MSLLDGKELGKFKLVDIFPGRVKRGDRLKSSDRKVGSTILVTAGSENYGLSGYIDGEGIKNTLFTGESITIDMFGNVFYRNHSFYCDDNVHVFQNEEISSGGMKFLTGAIAKAFDGKYGYSWQFREKKANDYEFSLPTTSDGSPDWDYMEAYIADIERKYVDNVRKFNRQEMKILKEIYPDSKHPGEPCEVKTFKIGDLFSINPTKAYKVPDSEIVNEEGEYYPTPFITTTESNNGMKGISGLKPNNPGNVITFSDTTGTDSIFYQERPYIGRSHVQEMREKSGSMNKESALYIISVIKHAVQGIYSYGFKMNRKRMSDTDILLPSKSDGSPDWNYMERYMLYIGGGGEKQNRKMVQLQNELILSKLARL